MRLSPFTILSLAKVARPSLIPLSLRITSHRAFRTTFIPRRDFSGKVFEDDSVSIIAANVAEMALPEPLPELPPIPSEQVLREVFSHPSSITFSGDPTTSPQSNERLEFLGDSYLNFCVSAILFRAFPRMTPGDLTRVRSGVVSNSNLCRWARAYGFHNQLHFGTSMQYLNLAEREKQVADCFEAYIGGVITTHPEGNGLVYMYLEAMVKPTLDEQQRILDEAIKVDKQAVSKLYELAARNNANLEFKFDDTNAPGALDRWEAICIYNGDILGRAKAKNQQDAKHRAAAQTLEVVLKEA